MNKNLLKLLSALMLLLLPAIASAAPIKVYLLKSSAWPTTKIHAWHTVNGKDIAYAAWEASPTMATETIDNVEYFTWTAPEDYNPLNIIFKDTNGSSKTVDIKGITKDTFYKLNSTSSQNISVTVINPLVLANPTISREENTITITASADGGDVYYTIDGTEPGKDNGTKYEAPFALDADATVKAIQMKEVAKSEIVSFDFTFEYFSHTTVAAGVYAIGEGETVPQFCSTDALYVPVEGQPKVAGQPDKLFLIGNFEGKADWATGTVVRKCEGIRYGSCFVFEDVLLQAGTTADTGYFGITSSTGTDWNSVNGSRWGAKTKDMPLAEDTPADITKNATNGDINAWKVAAGTYRIIADFSSMKITLTKTAGPAFAPMTAAQPEGFKATTGTLYTADFTGAKNAVKIGETAFVITPESEKAYIVKDNAIETILPVSVELTEAENGVIAENTLLASTFGTKAARYNGIVFEGNEVKLSSAGFENNAIVNIAWEADNEQNLTFFGEWNLINATDVVEVIAKLPEGWSAIHYSIVSKLNGEHVAEGEFSKVHHGDYLSIDVPAHLIHSTITFSNSGAPAAAASKAVAQSHTYELAGKSMYFDNNGEHWGEQEYVTTGIEDVEVNAAPAEYFNLQGIRVTAPAAGNVYIRRTSNKVEKVVF